jgi:hypothetical protein
MMVVRGGLPSKHNLWKIVNTHTINTNITHEIAMIIRIIYSSCHRSTLIILCCIFYTYAYKECVLSNECSVGSECTNGRCSNPFAKGCLVTLNERGIISTGLSSSLGRVNTTPVYNNFNIWSCSSYDDETSKKQNCQCPIFPYEEVRILPGNWRRSLHVSLHML